MEAKVIYRCFACHKCGEVKSYVDTTRLRKHLKDEHELKLAIFLITAYALQDINYKGGLGKRAVKKG